MNEKIKVSRRFDSDKQFYADSWNVANRAVFSASVNAEIADIAEERCIKRAMRFHKLNPDTHVVLYRIEGVYGGTYIHVHVRKNSCTSHIGEATRIIVPCN